MKPFLQQIAEHYIGVDDLKDRLFIFPNRRSMVFFRHYLGQCAKANSKVMMTPLMTTVSDFYSKASGCDVADRITLLQTMYNCYKELYGKDAESFDNFVYWGDTLTSDFSDIDKYMVNAVELFANIKDLKDIEGDITEYTNEEQRKAISTLVGHFRCDEKDSAAKKSFLKLWQILAPLYSQFREKLGGNLAYDGLIYRKVAEKVTVEGASVVDILSIAFPDVNKFVFVGLTAISKAEELTMKKMKDAGVAEFCWDFDWELMKDKDTFKFIQEAKERFGQAVDLEGNTNKPQINIFSVPSSVAQAKMLPDIITNDAQHKADTLETAIVLADEKMLMPVLDSLPSNLSTNVTMGYPLSSTEWASLMRDLIELQLNIIRKDGKAYFYHKPVHNVLSSSTLVRILDKDERKTVYNLKKKAEYRINESAFAGSEVLETIFKPVVTDAQAENAEQNSLLANYLLDVIEELAGKLLESNSLQKEAALQYYNCIKRMGGMSLAIRPKTWAHLLESLASGISVPFNGEPLGGLQVMGPLETRALDFKNIVILNANEDIFPRKASRPSFIPPELRTAFGLPTYDKQDNVWAYFFYRMICRAEKVFLLYDSRTEGTTTGEESRFIKQLKYLYSSYCSSIKEYVGTAPVNGSTAEQPIPKTQEDIDAIKNHPGLSASSIQKYLACPAQFYYYVIKKLYAEDEVKENADPGTLGDVCHDTLQALYSKNSEECMKLSFFFDKRDPEVNKPVEPYEITFDTLKDWHDNRSNDIKAKINALICNKLHCESSGVTGRDLVTAQIAFNFVMKVLETDINRLEKGPGKFTVIGVELKRSADICGHHFKGFIDRLDTFGDGTYRVVDYKTGNDKQAVLDKKLKADLIFKSNTAHENKAALQFFIYDKFVQNMFEGLPADKIKNAMYSMTDLFDKDHGIKDFDITEERLNAIEAQLQNTFDEKIEAGDTFERISDDQTCKWCDYKLLCGKVTKNN